MENSKLYPFERNRFYSGKLLASADFESEQRYFNDKRRFLNKMLYGTGIVSGMQVSCIDDFSIMLETGLALDNCGREIVVTESAVKRLSTITGFSASTASKLALCIEYHEEQTTPVHTIDDAQDYQNNRVAEGYKLMLMDNSSYQKCPEAELEFLHSRTIYQDDDYRINIEIPKYISSYCAVLPVISIEKLSDTASDMTFEAVLQSPAFETEQKQHQLKVLMDISAKTLEIGEKISRSYALTPNKDISDKAVIMIKADAVTVLSGNVTKKPEQDILLTMNVEADEQEKIIRRRVAEISLEKHFEKVEPSYLKIAEISLNRNIDTYIIDSVSQQNCTEKLYTSLQNVYCDRFSKFFEKIEKNESENFKSQKAQMPKNNISQSIQKEDLYTTGIVDIPLDLGNRGGEIYFSDPIMHRLGLGNVFIEAGYEFVTVNSDEDSSRITIYGEQSLFSRNKEDVPNIQTAIRLDTAKGTFTVAVKLLEKVDAISLHIRWFAMRLPNSDNHTAVNHEGKAIYIKPATITVAPKESCCIQVAFENMAQEACDFEVVGKNAGRITDDGIYTAPAIEGVYEVKVSVIEQPSLYTYAYIVVKSKQ